MPTPITGSVVWSADALSAGFGSALRLKRFVVNAAETFAYFPDGQAAATQTIYRLNLATQAWTQLYAPAFFTTPVQSVALSADEATLYSGTIAIGGTTPHIYTSNTDGSGTATDALNWTFGSYACAYTRMFRDPVTGFLMGADSSGRNISYINPAALTAPANYFSLPNAQFLAGVSRSRFDATQLLAAHTINCASKYVCRYRNGRLKAIAGNGTNSAISVGSAFAQPIGDVVDMQDDSSNNVYLGAGNNVYTLINGTTALIKTGGYDVNGGMQYLPLSNRLLIANGTSTATLLQ